MQCSASAPSHLSPTAAGDGTEEKTPFFRTIDRQGSLTNRRMTRNDVLRRIKRRGTSQRKAFADSGAAGVWKPAQDGRDEVAALGGWSRA